MNGDRVLVTGAGGFIGRWAAKAVISRNYETHAVLSRGDPDAELRRCLNGAQLYQANLLEPDQVSALVGKIKPTHLLHFAWFAKPGYWGAPENFQWVSATLNLASSFWRSGGKRLVAAGSCAEYDWSRVGVCEERCSPLATDSFRTASPYATCKVATGKMLEQFGKQLGVSVAWGRIFFQYGPHEPPQKLVASVAQNLLKKREALCSRGDQIRSFLHVEDVGDAFGALLDSDIEGPINIGSDHAATIAEVVEIVASIVGRRDLIRFGRQPVVEEPALLLPSISRLSGEVGWSPKFSLQDGLADAVEWWRRRTGKI